MEGLQGYRKTEQQALRYIRFSQYYSCWVHTWLHSQSQSWFLNCVFDGFWQMHNDVLLPLQHQTTGFCCSEPPGAPPVSAPAPHWSESVFFICFDFTVLHLVPLWLHPSLSVIMGKRLALYRCATAYLSIQLGGNPHSEHERLSLLARQGRTYCSYNYSGGSGRKIL